MRKKLILAVLFFGGLWGISEAVLGGALYRVDLPHASSILTAIGLIILTFAAMYFPRAGVGTAIASFAMLYKFLNEPFFACHLLGIFMVGLCYDLFLHVARIRNKTIAAVSTVYTSYALFALMMTYIVGYAPWVEGGAAKVLSHVAITGSIAALACAVCVPLSIGIADRLKQRSATPFGFRWRPLPGGVPIVTVGLWLFGIAAYLLS
jgi:hypothetical protein